MKVLRYSKRVTFFSIFLIFFLFLFLDGAAIKLKVVIDNARIRKTPELGGETIARVPMETILTVQEKQGEWYKVTVISDGDRTTGYIFEAYVEVIQEQEAAMEEAKFKPAPEREQKELESEIQSKIDVARIMILENKNYEKAIETLRPLLAKTFRVTNNNRQRELATEIYLLTGYAYTGEDNAYTAISEFKNMFVTDHAYAKESTRNIFDSKVIRLIRQAEDVFLGKSLEYSIEIVTDPIGAMIRIDGEEKNVSPLRYTIKSEVGPPKFILSIEKEGYKPITEEITLVDPLKKKTYALEALARDVEILSIPKGANVYLDGKDTGKVTNCILPRLNVGTYRIRVEKKQYNVWEESVEVGGGKDTFRIEVELTVKEYKILLTVGGPDKEFFELPKALALDKDNSIYVIDTSKTKIKKLDAQLQLQTGWGSGGKDTKNLKDPAGIAVDSEGSLYVTDIKNHNVMKFDKSGNFVTKWGKMGEGDENFNTPLGIAVGRNNDVYVADSRNNRIKKYSSKGELKKAWGQRGDGTGSFFYPAAIAVNQKGEVFVVDRNRVQKFTSEGEFIAAWGKPGQGDGEFSVPMGIIIDSENSVYVADSSNNRIQKFDESGNFIVKWGTQGSGEGQLNFPAGIVVDNRGYVFVVERDNQRVQAFGIESK